MSKMHTINMLYMQRAWVLNLELCEFDYIFRDAVFLTFVGIPTFSDVPTFLFCFVCMQCMCNDHACQLVAFWAVLIEKKLQLQAWTPTRVLPRPPIPRYFPTFLNSPSGIPVCYIYVSLLSCDSYNTNIFILKLSV